jgi:hypothetical protein
MYYRSKTPCERANTAKMIAKRAFGNSAAWIDKSNFGMSLDESDLSENQFKYLQRMKERGHLVMGLDVGSIQTTPIFEKKKGNYYGKYEAVSNRNCYHTHVPRERTSRNVVRHATIDLD